MQIMQLVKPHAIGPVVKNASMKLCNMQNTFPKINLFLTFIHNPDIISEE